MEFLTKAWNWFNGNKVTIGLVLGYLLSKTWFQNFVGADVFDAIEWVSATFITVGVVHKIAKSNTKPEPNK